MNRVVLDTCVILDALQRREPFWHDAAALFRAAANNEYEGIVTAKSMTDIYYLMHRHTHGIEESKSVINRLAQLFVVADTAADDILLALTYDMSDFEDAVMVATAMRVQAHYIVTRNERDYKSSPIEVIRPERLLDMLS